MTVRFRRVSVSLRGDIHIIFVMPVHPVMPAAGVLLRRSVYCFYRPHGKSDSALRIQRWRSGAGAVVQCFALKSVSRTLLHNLHIPDCRDWTDTAISKLCQVGNTSARF